MKSFLTLSALIIAAFVVGCGGAAVNTQTGAPGAEGEETMQTKLAKFAPTTIGVEESKIHQLLF